eukprot:COSAG02_NODE_4845_length_4912_cov_11.302514_3_plen_50_part_00
MAARTEMAAVRGLSVPPTSLAICVPRGSFSCTRAGVAAAGPRGLNILIL